MKSSAYNPQLVYHYVIYARMSSDRQNARSPESQIDSIRQQLRRAGYAWTEVAIYIDRAVSGRYERRRPEYQRMLRDIRLGKVKVDLIVVDTIDRFSRSTGLRDARAKLERQGVLVVTANSMFADPTDVAGKINATVDEIRACAENSVKGYQVRRGKTDAIRLKKWYGAPLPLGYRLLPVTQVVNGMTVFAHNTIEPDPTTQWIVLEIFRLADEFGYGPTRIAQALNADERAVAAAGNSFCAATIGEILQRRLYTGQLWWNLRTCDVIRDVRVQKQLPESEWIRMDDYCQAIVSVEQWDRVNELRKARRPNRAVGNSPRRGIAGFDAPGVPLRYPLSGLLYCGHCRRAMTASSGPLYVDKQGQERRYVYYGCPDQKFGGICSNRCRVPEGWIREVTFGLVREGLGLNDCTPDSPQVRELTTLVKQAFQRQQAAQPNRREVLLAEKAKLDSQQMGWLMSLGDSQLAPEVRAMLQNCLADAKAKVNSIAAELNAIETCNKVEEEILDPQRIVASLQDLARSMGEDNPAATSLLLAQHIDGIFCYSEGKCVVRLCKLGALAGELDSIPFEAHSSESTLETTAPNSGTSPNAIVPRRRMKRDARAAIHDDEVLDAANDFAADPFRFAGLGPEFFIVREFQVPEPQSWASRNARIVAEYRQLHQATMQELSEQFGVSIPTIRHALREAAANSELNLLGNLPNRENKKNWAKRNAAAVAEYMRVPGRRVKDAIAHFGKSEPTIKKALKYAAEKDP